MRDPIRIKPIPGAIGLMFFLHIIDSSVLAIITGNKDWFENGWLMFANFVTCLVLFLWYNCWHDNRIIEHAKKRSKLMDEATADNFSEESIVKIRAFDANANKPNKVATIAKWMIICILALFLIVFILAVHRAAGF